MIFPCDCSCLLIYVCFLFISLVPVVPGVLKGVTKTTKPKVINLNWNKPTFIGGATSYTVNYRIFGTSTWSQQTVAGTSTKFDLTGVTQGKQYEVYVVAIGVTGKSSRKTNTVKIDTHPGKNNEDTDCLELSGICQNLSRIFEISNEYTCTSLLKVMSIQFL